MFVFIDESGDAGFKLTQGSSEHFVIACCVFNSTEDAELAADVIRSLRTKLGWHQGQEFKFSKTREDIRIEFFREVKKSNFFVRSIVIDKKIIRSPNLQTNKTTFYNFAIQEVLSNSFGTIHDAKVRIDGKASRDYVKAINKYLKEQANTDINVVSNVKFVDSKGNQLIQLADMFAGAIRKSQDGGNPKQSLYSDALKPFLKRSASDIWLFDK